MVNIKPPSARASVTISLRVTIAQRDRLFQLAEEQQRPLSNYLQVFAIRPLLGGYPPPTITPSK